MIESRCGLKCSECSYREAMNCQGCTQTAKPFWAPSCPIKSCCNDQKHEHCGQCAKFSCDLLKQFAFDEKQGDNGERIEQCKRWSQF